MLDTKDIVKEMKNDFDRFTRRLDTAKDRNSELEDMLIESSQTEKCS